MNGCNLPLVIMKPFKNPTNAPITKAAKTATNIPLPDTKREAQTAPLMARIEPTDKSIHPVNITKVIPAAIIPLTEVCLKILNIFFELKNDGLSIETTTIKVSSPTKLLYFINVSFKSNLLCCFFT